MIKAIETVYNGYRFRSRLEARWAVFFDTLGVRWEYEKEGYKLENGISYLPDFWLPETKRWIEIKGQYPTTEELSKAEYLLYGTGYPVCIFYGSPGEHDGLAYYLCAHVSGNGGVSFSEDVTWRICPGCAIPDTDLRCHDDCALYGYEEGEDINTCGCSYQRLKDYWNTASIIEAYTTARQARFEHGEKPRI